jgi:Na+/H+ antiporter NhaC
MNRTMWILLVLIAALSIATIWRDQQGLPAPSHTLCKESLVAQIFTGACTLRLKGEAGPS